MKIIYLHQYFAALESAGGTRSYEMARRMVSSGHTVQLITTSAYLPREWNLKAGWNVVWYEGIKLHVLHRDYSNRTPFVLRIIRFVEFALRCSIRLTSLSGDLVFATSTPLTIAIPAVFGKKYLNAPMIFEVRDVWPEMPVAIGLLKNSFAIFMAKELEKFAYRHASAIVALSEGMKKSIVERNVVAEKVAVIPNSCDFQLFRDMSQVGKREYLSHSVFKSEKLVVYLGTLGRINGLRYLVELCRALWLLDPEVKVAVFGDGMEREDLVAYARDVGVFDKNLFFFEPVTKKQIPAILKKARLSLSLFLPIQEMWSNSANKFFDALASGTAVAINYRGWQAGYLEEYSAGIVMDPLDVELSAASIAKLLADSYGIEKMGRNAAFLGASCFDRDALADTLLSVMEEVLAADKSSEDPIR
jgi:glycosyltransferase involved in cell wall biosynthesis